MDSPISGPRRVDYWFLARRVGFSLAGAVVLLLVGRQFFPGLLMTALGTGEPILSRPLPEFTETSPNRWLNSKPLRVADLKGEVVLLEVWTFGCVNCVRSLPWVQSLIDRFGERGLRVVGIHSPEFGWEKGRDAVGENLRRRGIGYPVMMDNEYAFWKKLNNRYWPTFYLAGRNGTIQLVHLGETHVGDGGAMEVERMIERLLREN